MTEAAEANEPIPPPQTVDRVTALLDKRDALIEQYTKVYGKPPTPPDTIQPDEEEQIRWFFDSGIATFERSTFGAQLERLAQMAIGSYECHACDGRRFVPVRLAVCKHCRGGWVSGDRKGDLPKRCGHCQGDCVVELSEGSMRRDAYEVQGLCDSCCGTGVTARLRGHKRRSGSMSARPGVHREWRPPTEPDGYDLERYGMVVRRLMRLPQRHALVLFAYYWVGQSYAADKTKGPLWPVMGLTAAGKRLIEKNAKKPPKALSGRQLQLSLRGSNKGADPRVFDDGLGDDWLLLTQPELFTELLNCPIDGSQESKQRVAMIKRARGDAAKLYVEACQAWNGLDVERVKREESERASKRRMREGREFLRKALRVVELRQMAPRRQCVTVELVG